MEILVSFFIVLVALYLTAQNAALVTIGVFAWTVTTTLSVLIFGTFLMGAMLGFIYLAPAYWRHRKAIKTLEKQLAAVTAERDAQIERATVLESQILLLAPLEDKSN